MRVFLILSIVFALCQCQSAKLKPSLPRLLKNANNGNRIAVSDLSSRGAAIFVIDPVHDCQSCLVDLEEYFLAFSDYR